MVGEGTEKQESTARPVKKSFVHKVPCPIGRPRRFKSPRELWDKFVEYCDEVENNPWEIKSASNSLDSNINGNVNRLHQDVQVRARAYTLYGFCAFAGIYYKWADFRKNYSEIEGFRSVIAQIENVVTSQQLDGAMINQFNSGLVARLNGFADIQNVELVDKFKLPNLTNDEIEELRKINGV